MLYEVITVDGGALAEKHRDRHADVGGAGGEPETAPFELAADELDLTQHAVHAGDEIVARRAVGEDVHGDVGEFELGDELGEGELAGLIGGHVLFGVGVDLDRKVFRVRIDRITSYNVCYTKLLRFAVNFVVPRPAGYYFVCPAENLLQPKVQAVRAWLRGEFRVSDEEAMARPRLAVG